MRLASLTAIAFLIAGTGAQAQALDCSNPQDQRSMNECAHQAWEAADGDLNLAYRLAMNAAKSMDEFTPEWQEKTSIVLRDAQRAWIPFRDKACELESHQARGGTMQPLIFWGCMEKLTRDRTEQLRAFGEVN